MRILFLTQWFDPEPNPKGLEFARALVDRGFEVEVLTGFPNYPGGRVYPGYKIRPVQREVMNGVHVTRVALFPAHDQSVIRRLLNYFSFMLSALFYVLFVARKPDVAYVYHPPLTVGVVATVLRIFRRVPFIYDVQDLWPYTLKATGMISSSVVLAAVGWVCKGIYRMADRIVVLSPGFKASIVAQGVPEDKVQIVYNWAGESALASRQGVVNQALCDKSRFKIVFAGTMGKAQGLDTVLEAAHSVQAELPEVQFFLVGGGIEVSRLQEKATSLALTNITFLPRVPMCEVGLVLLAADALLVNLKADPLFDITVPSKTQAYMAMGKPILMVVGGDAAQLVSQANCGFAVQPGDAGALVNAIKRMIELTPAERSKLGENGGRFYRSHLSMKVGVDKFAELFRATARAS